MSLKIRLEGPYEDQTIAIGYRQLHAMRRMMIDGAVDHIMQKQDDMRVELGELDVDEDDDDGEDKMEDDDDDAKNMDREESEAKQKVLAERINHAKNALEEINKLWLLDHEVIIAANNIKGKKGKDLEDAHEAMKKVNTCPYGIDYSGIPTRQDCSKDDKVWVRELSLMGLILFVSHADNDGMYSPGEALDMMICIESLEDRVMRLVEKKPAQAEKGQKLFGLLTDFKEMCRVSSDKRINIRFT